MEELNTDDLQSFGAEIVKRAKVEKEIREKAQKEKEDNYIRTIEELELMKEKNQKLTETIQTYTTPFINSMKPVNWRPLGIEQVAKHLLIFDNILNKLVKFCHDNQNPTRRITATTLPIKVVEIAALTKCKEAYKDSFQNLWPVLQEVMFELEKKKKNPPTRKRNYRKKNL